MQKNAILLRIVEGAAKSLTLQIKIKKGDIMYVKSLSLKSHGQENSTIRWEVEIKVNYAKHMVL